MPYRGVSPVEQELAEQRELFALARGARLRRVRAAMTLCGLGLALPLLAITLGQTQPRHELACHRVTVVWTQSEGTPPPPMEWTSCRDPSVRSETGSE